MKKLDNILLIDDDPTTNYLNERLLSKLDIANSIIINTNAKNALTYLSRECRFANKFPNIIFLDLKMPNIDGFDFLKEFQKMCFDIRKDIMIVILSSSTHIEDVIRLNHLGNFCYLSKPLTADKISEVLTHYINLGKFSKQIA